MNKKKDLKSKVFIRVDGGSQLGLGHLVRCLALAQMIKPNFQVDFYACEIPNPIVHQIINSGFSVHVIHSEDDFINLVGDAEIVVLDKYGLGLGYQEEIKKRGPKLVVIDDLHEEAFAADLIINHAPGVTSQDYRARHYTQFALGLDFALLRSAFLQEAKRIPTDRPGDPRRLFIGFGGADSRNLTLKTLNLALSDDYFDSINVVLGSSFAFTEAVEQAGDSTEKVKIFQGIDADEMIKIMKESDVAVVPASGILLETLTLGLLPISGMYVDNQKFFYLNYKSQDLIIDAHNFSEDAISVALKKARVERRKMKRIIDGKSGDRILKFFNKLILEKELELRVAEIKDKDVTFKWAVAPEVRAFSFSREKIEYEEHQKWFSAKIKSPDVLYLIATYQNKTAGSIRFDQKGDKAVISYLTDPDFHGFGLGSIILKKGVDFLKKCRPEVKEIVGDVLTQNVASIKIFERLGYLKEKIDQQRYQFTKKII